MINKYSTFQKRQITSTIKNRLFPPRLKKLSYDQLNEFYPADLKDALEYVSSIYDLPSEDIKEIFQNNFKKTDK